MADTHLFDKKPSAPILPEIIDPNADFLDQLEAAGPFQASACYQCRKCTNGCPVSFAMDLYPDEVIRLVIIGLPQIVLRCHTIWVCAACETCTTRCPNDVKIAELMDGLKELAIQEGIPCPQPRILTLHETFLLDLKKRGRVNEASFLPKYLLRSGMLRRMWQEGTLRDEFNLGRQMRRKGRLPLHTKKISGKKEVRNILGRKPKRSIRP